MESNHIYNDETINRPVPYQESDEVNLLDILMPLVKRKKMIAYTTVGVTIFAAIISFLLPKTFTATTLLLAPQQTQSNISAMLAQLNPVAAGLSRDLGLKNPGELYVALLKSRTVEDNLINKFDLRKIYGYKTYLDTRKKLEDRSDFKVLKEGTIEISVEDRDPARAAEIANSYTLELQKLTEVLAVTEASQRRLYYERQLLTAKNNLSDAEVALKETQEKTGLIQLDGQAKVIIEAAATLQAQIAAKEIQLQRLRLSVTDQNPVYKEVMQELSGLREQLEKMEQKKPGGNGDIQLGTAKVPAAGLEYIRRFRNVKYYETIYELLAKQYEVAKLDEAKGSAIVQVIDKAVEPEKKSYPNRLLIILVSSFASFFFSLLAAFIQDMVQCLMSDPRQSEKIRFLRASLSNRQ